MILQLITSFESGNPMICPTLGIKVALNLFWKLIKNVSVGILIWAFRWFEVYWGFDAKLIESNLKQKHEKRRT